MSADWTTCRVVRDRAGDLWGRERGGWNLITSGDTESWAPSDDFLADHYSPITPVLDADGLPVVHTVGDLTARHIGRRVRVEGWGETVFREVFPTQHGARCMFADGDHELAATFDIPCEVLP